MGYFRDTDHLYEVLGALFTRLRDEEAIAEKLLEGNLIIRFIFAEPDGQATVDLTKEPIAFVLGESELEPDVEMSQSADTAHLFWLGRKLLIERPKAPIKRVAALNTPIPYARALENAVVPDARQIRKTVLELF